MADTTLKEQSKFTLVLIHFEKLSRTWGSFFALQEENKLYDINSIPLLQALQLISIFLLHTHVDLTILLICDTRRILLK